MVMFNVGEDGCLFITLECSTFEEVEGQLNSLQDEQDEIRESPPGVPSGIGPVRIAP
jgi:hypothetical protein